MGPPSSEGTEAICRVPSGYFSQTPWYTLPFHLCRFRVRSIRRGYFLGQFRSEEHTSELQSLMRISYAVFCLKKKKKLNYRHNQKYNMIHNGPYATNSETYSNAIIH